MNLNYKKLQIIKHALQYYLQRPNMTKSDIKREIELLTEVEMEIDELKEKYDIPTAKNFEKSKEIKEKEMLVRELVKKIKKKNRAN